MLRDGQRVVGTLLPLYSERLVAGRLERFCNLTSWCALPDYGSRNISLLTALPRQRGYYFTVLTPDVGPPEPDKRIPPAVARASLGRALVGRSLFLGLCPAFTHPPRVTK